jgi:hypothetical protein
MNDPQVFHAGRVAAVVCIVLSGMITTAVGLTDALELSKQHTAIALIIQTGLTALVGFLPQVQKTPGDVRGDSDR